MSEKRSCLRCQKQFKPLHRFNKLCKLCGEKNSKLHPRAEGALKQREEENDRE